MKLATPLGYADNFHAAARAVRDFELAGLDVVMLPEAYGFDAVSRVGYLAAVTDRLQIATGILNVFSRTPALMAMTAAGCDDVSEGRFTLGLGASGPQVVEGFHGVAYEKPRTRVIEYIQACRSIWRREQAFSYQGEAIEAPLSSDRGSGLGKPLKLINRPRRSTIPIWWASLGLRSVEETAALADGWQTALFAPRLHHQVWGPSLEAGRARRPTTLGPLDIVAGGMVAIGDHLVGDAKQAVLDMSRPTVALYVGGMGARGRNYYNDVVSAYGFGDAAKRIQDLYLEGKKEQAAAAVPPDLLDHLHLVGPAEEVREAIDAHHRAGVTVLSVTPVGPDPVRTIETVRLLLPSE